MLRLVVRPPLSGRPLAASRVRMDIRFLHFFKLASILGCIRFLTFILCDGLFYSISAHYNPVMMITMMINVRRGSTKLKRTPHCALI